MIKMKQVFILLCIFCYNFIFLFPVFTQAEEEEKLDAYTIAKMKYEDAMELYREGEYEKSLKLVNTYIQEFEEKRVRYPRKIKADIYVLRAMLLYAFREEGYREEVENLFRQAIKINLDIEIGDATQVPPLLIEIFKKIKKEYLDQYSKKAKRHIIGLVTTLIYTEEFVAGSFQPGLYYAFNINKFLSISTTVKLGMGDLFWNTWHFKIGSILYSDYRVEKFVFGIGLYNIFSISHKEDLLKNSISLCGHGEFFTRRGFGLAADIEVFRFDINIKSAEPVTIYQEQKPIQLIYANFDLYFLFTL